MQIDCVGLVMKSHLDAFRMSISGRRQGLALRVIRTRFDFLPPALATILRAAHFLTAARPALVRVRRTERLPPWRKRTVRVFVRRAEWSSKVEEKLRNLTRRFLPETTLTWSPCLRIACCLVWRIRTLRVRWLAAPAPAGASRAPISRAARRAVVQVLASFIQVPFGVALWRPQHAHQ